MNKLRYTLLAILALVFSSCYFKTGGPIDVKADDLEYPVSLTKAIFDENYKPNTSNYTVVKSFSFTRTSWFWHWTANPGNETEIHKLSEDPDISKDLNDLIKASNGDAIVNLKIVPEVPLYDNVIATLSVLNLYAYLPYPVAGTLIITGDVIKVNK